MLLLLACTAPPAEDAAPDGIPASADPWGASVPMAPTADGQPTVAGTLDGGAATWALDTGSDSLYVDAARLDRNVGHVDVTVGPVALGSVLAHGLDLAEADAAAGVALDGLAGQALFADRVVGLSYTTGEAWFPADLPDQAPPPCDGDAAVAPYAPAGGVPVSDATFAGPAGEVPLALVADTGSGVTLLTESAFATIDDGSLLRVPGYVWATTYGSDDAFLTRIPTITVGDATFADTWAVVVPDDNHLLPLLAAAGLDVDGFLGWPVWREGCLAVDGVNERYLWWAGGSGAPAHEWDRVPVQLAWDDPGFSITMVFGGAADVLAGDQLLAIDGTALDGHTLAEAQALLRGEPGETRTLSLERGDETWDETMTVEALLPDGVR
jgi:hypothetical protein